MPKELAFRTAFVLPSINDIVRPATATSTAVITLCERQGPCNLRIALKAGSTRDNRSSPLPAVVLTPDHSSLLSRRITPQELRKAFPDKQFVANSLGNE